MKFLLRNSTPLTAYLAACALAVPILAIGHSSQVSDNRGNNHRDVVVAYPWAFQEGERTARETVLTTVGEIGQKAGFEVISSNDASIAWESKNYPAIRYRHMPTKATLTAFARSIHASKVLYGSVSWHTRSIWVTMGPKTISTATVNAYVFDVASNKIVYRKQGVTGRSDERESIYKVAADVLVTPLVSAVSGGPATPREQRAVQIALGTAYRPWVRTISRY